LLGGGGAQWAAHELIHGVKKPDWGCWVELQRWRLEQARAGGFGDANTGSRRFGIAEMQRRGLRKRR
jgi:hypothetical protein